MPMKKDKKVAVASIKNPSTFYDKFNNWFVKNDPKVFYTLIGACLFLSFISFNARISEAHDDALYLEAGWRYVNEFPKYFYTQNAPLYPLFLGLLVKIIGFKLMVFKLFSVVFNLAGFILFYKALKNRIPAIIFVPVVIFHATNHLIIYYASMTFTESFYFFLQGLTFYYALKIIDTVNEQGVQLRPQLKLWILFGLSMFLISTAKSSAIVIIPAALLFFALYKNWKAAGYTLGAYLIFKIPYELLVKVVWNGQNQFKGQSKILLQKDPYNAAAGNEDLAGFIQRFVDNCDLYIGKRFYQLLGWRDELKVLETPEYGMVAFITIVIALIGFWLVVKQKNKPLIFLALFTGAQALLSFIILQARWDQPRIILVCMPVILILIFYVLFYFTNKPGIGQTIYVVIATLVIGSVLISSLKRGFTNLPIVQKNLKGDKYYGYTPDWQNFLKCSQWCADSLPKETLVASRKAPMSFVYGKGKKFFPIYSVIKKDSLTQQSNPDSAMAFFQKNKVTHIMLGSLRADPTNPSAGIINTVHNIFAPIANSPKYKDKIRLVHVEGDYEQTYLYELSY
ncbi:MAG: hypothetical protein JWO32_2733 [Bacteroidetes bacterium]|nr:hypothetical protein [Bacteroidota bacterium]